MAGVYIHIPFCKQLCSYCDFYFSVSLQRKDEMLKALLLEMELRKNEAEIIVKTNNNYPPTLYFGGGTPTVYSPDELKLIADTALNIYFPKGVEEFTVEANPDDLTPDYLNTLKSIGINRLSIGIQSFINRDLQWMRRRHTAKQAIESVKNAQKAGFDNISIDLIYGIPKMNMGEWEFNIKQALALNIPHISVYHLTIEPRTIIGKQQEKGLIAPIDDEVSAKQYELLETLTANTGYLHYEISNFAKKGYTSKHNSSYWLQQPYIGIGPSAHSYNGSDIRKWNIANNKKYIDCMYVNEPFYEVEKITLYDRYNEYVLTSLRTSWGADIEHINKLFGIELYRYFIQQAEIFCSTGLLVKQNNYIKIPSVHFLISDSIINQLFWV